MLKSLITIILVLIAIPLNTANVKIIDICVSNPIYCQVLKNNPKIDKDYAMKLSNAIFYIAKLHNINPTKYAAILAQESMYKLKAKNHSKSNCLDYGISQINCKTAEKYKFNVDKLTKDLVYSIQAGAIVLSDIKKDFAHKERDYWCRYNMGYRPKHKIKIGCEKYKKLVARYM